MNVTIPIPDDLGRLLATGEQSVAARVQLDLAIQYYQQGLVSAGRAAEMSGLRRGEFERVLGERQTVRNYSEEDLRLDLETGQINLPEAL